MIAAADDWLKSYVKARLKKSQGASYDYIPWSDAADEDDFETKPMYSVLYVNKRSELKGLVSFVVYEFAITMNAPSTFLNHSTVYRKLAVDMENLLKEGGADSALGYQVTLANGPTSEEREEQNLTSFVTGLIEVKLLKNIG